MKHNQYVCPAWSSGVLRSPDDQSMCKPDGCTRAHIESQKSAATPQMHCFNDFTAKHFTTLCAAFALTLHSLPKAIRFPAFLAGLNFFFTMQTPGMVNLPVLLASFWARSASASRIFPISDFLPSHAVAKASAIAPFEMDFTPFFIAFIPFMAFIAFFA